MICPRCGNEWDATRSPCTRCGLLIRLSRQSGPHRGASTPPQRSMSRSPATLTSTSMSESVPVEESSHFSTPSTSIPSFVDIDLKKIPPVPAKSNDTFGQTVPQTRAVQTDLSFPRSIPQRPRLPQKDRITDALKNSPMQNQRSASPPALRASRLTTASVTKDVPSLEPGTLLRGGRYRLYEMQGRQEWLSGTYEAMWIAQDAQRAGSQVMMCELVLPESSAVGLQSTLQTATLALTSVSKHLHIPTLWDAFSDRGRHFFVFEPVEGESLLARMRRTGRGMHEQDVIECCLQMIDVLELLAQQSPPLVHGLLSPEHIIIGRPGQYTLTNLSIVLAGGATQFISGLDRTRLSAGLFVYSAPEFMRGLIDVRSDLYALIATAYHMVTGSPPTGVGGSIPQAQRLNPNVSSQFDAILAKGLRPVAGQRYQHPSELRQALLALRSVSGTLVSGSGQTSERTPIRTPLSGKQPMKPVEQSMPDTVARTLQSLATVHDFEEQKSRPEEELLPTVEKKDWIYIALWVGAIILCVLLIVILIRGFL